MAEKLVIEVEARFTDTAAAKLHFSWPSKFLTDATHIGELVTSTPDEGWVVESECPITTGNDFDISSFAALEYAMIQNTDGSNFVTVTYDDAAAVTVAMVLAAGKIAILPDVDPSATFNITADTAAVVCKVAVVGS